MITPAMDLSDIKQFMTWLAVLLIFVVGFRHAREVMAFVLDKLYQFFIQNNPGNV